MDLAYIPTAAITSGMQTSLSIVFLTGSRDSVVDWLDIPSHRRSTKIVFSEYFVAVSVATVEDSPTIMKQLTLPQLIIQILNWCMYSHLQIKVYVTWTYSHHSLLIDSLHLASFSATPESFLTLALCHRHICNVLAKFAYDTLWVFEQREMFVFDSVLYLKAVVLPMVTSSIHSNLML